MTFVPAAWVEAYVAVKVVAVAEVRDAIGAAIVTSIQGGDVKAAADKAAADMKRIMAETEGK